MATWHKRTGYRMDEYTLYHSAGTAAIEWWGRQEDASCFIWEHGQRVDAFTIAGLAAAKREVERLIRERGLRLGTR